MSEALFGVDRTTSDEAGAWRTQAQHPIATVDTPTIEMPAAAEPELEIPAPAPITTGGVMRIEQRGYEVARRVELPDGDERWEMYATYRPSDLALAQARADAKWLQMRNPRETYRVRAVVSLDPQPVLPSDAAPLVLDADEQPEQGAE